MPGTEGNWAGVFVSEDHVISLYFFDSYLIGSIPSELGNLINLGFLSLSWNQLSGSIPSQFGNLKYLISLDLIWNKLGNWCQVNYLNYF